MFWLDEATGCVNTDVEVSGGNQLFKLRAYSRADVYGQEVVAHNSYQWSSKPISVVQWTVSAVDGGVRTRLLPLTQTWQALAVGTWTFYRNSWHLDQGPSRQCCLSSATSYQPDGTCASTPGTGEAYEPVDDAVRFFVAAPDPTRPTKPCGGSSLDGHPAVAVACAKKGVIAHELGHVVVGMRMGGRDQKNQTAPLDDCMGDYRDDPALGIIALDDGGDKRGIFTKEYMSAAFREGWAVFFTSWAWNRKTDEDCEQHNDWALRDFDLDGVMDVGETDTFDCTGTPYPGADPPNPPMDHQHWLGDMIASSADCHAGDPDHAGNRAAVYDVARMFWTMIEQDQDPVPPAVLADIYIDMCPRGWAVADTCHDDDPDDFPINRWIIAQAGYASHFPFYDGFDHAQDHIFYGWPTCE